MKSKIFLFVFTIIFIKVLTGATTYLDDGICYNFSFQESTFNNATNQTIFSNRTETFCANQTEDNSLGFCSINKTIKPGEIFSKKDSSCNIGVSCEMNVSLFEHEIAYDITADLDYIRVTIGTDTKSYPRDADGFTYNGIKTIMCPTLEAQVQEGDPKSLQDCLSILKNTKELTSDERKDYEECQTTRDNFKVEWETRGRELEDCNQKLGTRTQEKENYKDDLQSASITNWILLIFDLLFGGAWIIFGIIKLKNFEGGIFK